MKQQLVILPGWGGTKQSWQKFMDLAQINFELYFISLPGFGEVAAPTEVWGVEDYVNFIKRELEKLNLTRPILLGHSFGGQLAVNLVGNNPQLFSKLILSGAAVLRPAFRLRRTVSAGVAKLGKLIFRLPILNKLEKLARRALYRGVGSPDYNQTEGVQREIFKKVIRESQIEMLDKITIPTLVVWGDQDCYVPVQEGQLIARQVAGSELRIIPGGKHGLHIQQPDNLLKIIKEFIDK